MYYMVHFLFRSYLHPKVKVVVVKLYIIRIHFIRIQIFDCIHADITIYLPENLLINRKLLTCSILNRK